VGVPRALKNGVNKELTTSSDRSPSKLPGTSREVSSIKVNESLKAHGPINTPMSANIGPLIASARSCMVYNEITF
jgi:hypothetical protein